MAIHYTCGSGVVLPSDERVDVFYSSPPTSCVAIPRTGANLTGLTHLWRQVRTSKAQPEGSIASLGNDFKPSAVNQPWGD
jgi:hypothetical protein